MAIKLVEEADGVIIAVKVVPGSSRDRVVGELGDALKVAVSAPPEGGTANKAVEALLTEVLGLPRGSVTIVRGHSNPRKQVLIRGLTVLELAKRMAQLCS